jgi:hypothetical protein
MDCSKSNIAGVQELERKTGDTSRVKIMKF